MMINNTVALSTHIFISITHLTHLLAISSACFTCFNAFLLQCSTTCQDQVYQVSFSFLLLPPRQHQPWLPPQHSQCAARYPKSTTIRCLSYSNGQDFQTNSTRMQSNCSMQHLTRAKSLPSSRIGSRWLSWRWELKCVLNSLSYEENF